MIPFTNRSRFNGSHGLQIVSNKRGKTIFTVAALVAITCILLILLRSIYTVNAVIPPSILGRVESQQYKSISLADTASLNVNIANGNLILQNQDLNMKGSGLNLNLVSYYNSLSSAPGQLGNNTGFGLGKDVFVTSNSNGTVTYNSPSGTVATYTPNGSGGFSSPSVFSQTKLDTISTGWKITYNKSSEFFAFDSNGRQVRHESATGQAIVYSYNSNGTLATVIDTQGKTLTFSNYVGSKVGKVTDSSGRFITFGYTSDNLTSFTDANGNSWEYQYWSGSNLNQITDPRGYTTQISYDSSSRVTSITSNAYTSSAKTWNYSYNNGNSQTVVTDPLNHSSTFTYDGSGRVVSFLDAVGSTVQSTWDANNNPTTKVSASNYTTTATYDTNNNLTKLQNPQLASGNAGAYESYTFGNSAQPYLASSKRDGQGNITSYSYNTSGVLTSSSSTGAGATTYRIQGDSNGSGGTYNCSAKTGQMCASVDANGNLTSYTYDINGNVLSINYPSPRQPDTYTYDSLSRVKTYTNGNNSKVTYVYDNMDRPLSLTYSSDGSVVSYVYDKNGNRTERIGESGQTLWQYDGFNRVTKLSQQQGSTSTYKDINYTYDKADNLLTEAASIGTTTYTYDNANNIASINQPNNSGATMVYGFTDGRVTSVYYPGGIVQSIGYDRAGRQTSIKAVKGTTVLTDFTASYVDSAGVDSMVMQSEKDNITGITKAYTYDSLNRLSGVNSSPGSYSYNYSYTYDNNGNRTQSMRAGNYSAISGYNAANELVSLGGASYGSYDGAGNQTSNGTGRSFGYNAKNQTSSTTDSGMTLPSKYFDADPSSRATFGSAKFTYGLLGLYSENTSSAAVTYNHFVHLPSGSNPIVGMLQQGNNYFYLPDIHGSVARITDMSGTIQNSYAYDPYGKLEFPFNENIVNNIRYQGYYRDPQTLLYLVGARVYNPEEGRWTQPDPSGQDKHYIYAANNPVNYSDPSGLITPQGLGKAYLLGCATGGFTTLAVAGATALATGGLGLPVSGAELFVGCAYGAATAAIGEFSPTAQTSLDTFDLSRSLYRTFF